MHLSIILDPRADVLHAENAAEMAALYHRLLTDAARAGERELKLSAAAADGIPPAQAAHVTLRAIVETLRTLPPLAVTLRCPDEKTLCAHTRRLEHVLSGGEAGIEKSVKVRRLDDEKASGKFFPEAFCE